MTGHVAQKRRKIDVRAIVGTIRHSAHQRIRHAVFVADLRQRGAFNRFAYHASGPIRIGRDIVLALKPPQSLAADLDWIYGYRAVGLG